MSTINNDKTWQLNESGILRKKNVPKEELLVFGYSCKLFRDDQRALLIDQGKHLIPWMGDESLKIDRYDGRGTLYDLSMYEALPDGQDRWFGLSSEERYVEQMCDEERYRALTTNEDEEALYQEEELKRLQQALDGEKAYGQVGFTYSEEKKEEGEENETKKEEEEDEEDAPFIVPHELDIPVGMVVPEKTKLNAIIERTAQFICEQGAQMEVLLKMKQANNPQFQFLSFGSALHPYYRHVYMAIKTGRYRPQTQQQKALEEKAREEANSEHYLHPSLATVPLEPPEPAPGVVIPAINYKPSSDCAYSMLVNKIKEKQSNMALPSVPSLLPKEPTPPPAPSPPRISQPSPKIDHDESSNPSVEVGSIAVSTATTPVSNSTLRKRRKKARAEQALADSHFYAPEEDEDTCMEAPVCPIETPPPHMQLIIDKMASYVAKNGIDFEGIVKSKGDPRFSFLEEGHQYHPYYRQKVNLYMKLNPEASQSEQSIDSNGAPAPSTESNLSVDENSQEAKSRSKPVPVCFSIKKPKEAESLESRSALPVEESSEDEDSDDRNSNTSKSSKSNQETKKTEQLEKTGSHSTENNARWIEERVKDKLSATAKEKLLAKERERQIQQERKKRAAAFLNLLQKDRLVTSNHNQEGGSTATQNNVTEADDVESLPSPSSVIAISDNSSDEEENSGKKKKLNGSQVNHPVIDLSPLSSSRRQKRSPSPSLNPPKKKRKKHSSKSSKKSHSKSSHKSRHKSDQHRKHSKKHSRSESQKHSHKRHRHSSKTKRRHEKKSKHRSSSSSSSYDSESDSSSSSS
nr:PREDICTED: splicing factor, suppressor of white-apricot homolog [Bemisia tabaci]